MAVQEVGRHTVDAAHLDNIAFAAKGLEQRLSAFAAISNLIVL